MIASRARRRPPVQASVNSGSETYQRQGSSESSTEEEEDEEEEREKEEKVLQLRKVSFSMSPRDVVELRNGSKEEEEKIQEILFGKIVGDGDENRGGNDQAVQDASLTHYSQESQQRMPTNSFK